MNLAYRDIKHNLLRFVLTTFGLSLLLGVVIVITGVYRGLIDDALRQARAANADLWVVQAGTNGPFAEASRIPGDTREVVARVYGVERAGAVTYQTVQTKLRGAPLRFYLIGFELGRPGGPRTLIAGRHIMRSHYEMVVDRSAGLVLGQEVPLGTRGHKFTVVGLMRNEVTSSGDPVAYITLRDAQALQFELAPPAGRREVARGAELQTTSQINAVIAKVSPYVSFNEVAAALARWKHLTTLTQAQQESLLTKDVIERQRRQQLMILVLLVIVTAVIIALIIYTLTMDKVRSIATLKFIGAPDRTIIGLIVQQALAMGTPWLHDGTSRLSSSSRVTFRDGSSSCPKTSRSCSLLLLRSALPQAVSACALRSRSIRRQHSRRRGKAMVEANAQPVVRVEHLSKYFGAGESRVDALGDINMDVFPGQVVGLMGPSGSGKTTLLNCIACILEPSSGRLTLDGEVVYDGRWLRADLRRLRLDKVGFIFQYPNLLPFLDATDNVAEVLYLAGFGSAAGRSRAIDLLDYLEVGRRKNAMPAQLSGGEAQRVAIARALANRPRIILADEPTAPLELAASAHRDGPAAQDCGGTERGDHLRHPRRDDPRPLRSYLPAARRPARVGECCWPRSCDHDRQ